MSKLNYDELRREELIRLLKERDERESGGIRIHYEGQTLPWQIVRKVKPRRQKIIDDLCFGSEDDQIRNTIIEGENLQAMVSLYKYRGQIDLIVADPPYNTGRDFRYNDRWEIDPNDPDLGPIVAEADGSRHTKWLRFMTSRLWMMKEMLKPGGVLAICIDHRELFHLGMLLEQIFGGNQIAIINWQKAFSPKNSSKHISTATEYVLVYAKGIAQAKTNLLPRDEKSDSSFSNHDDDPEGAWAGKDPTAKEYRKNTVFGIQSPFTGILHYPDIEHDYQIMPPISNKHWTGLSKSEMKHFLEQWGSLYEERDLGDGRGKALVLKGSNTTILGYNPMDDPVVQNAKEAALLRSNQSSWPRLYFRADRNSNVGMGRPRVKNYLRYVQQGKVALTYWADEEYEEPIVLEAQSWNHPESGHSKAGINELDNIMGKGHDFETVKPLKLIKKIIHLWCPPKGIVLDPFAGSGTTAHAVLELNNEIDENDRRFILIEQGRPERGDSYARSLTRERIRRVLTGERPIKEGRLEITKPPIKGGFRFTQLTGAVDADAVLALEREEMLDLLLTSHWDQYERSSTYLKRLPAGSYTYLFAIGGRNQGYFLIWNGPQAPAVLDRGAFRQIMNEARNENLNAPYHVYARTCTYSGPNIEFYQIPDRILDKLGFNETAESLPKEEE